MERERQLWVLVVVPPLAPDDLGLSAFPCGPQASALLNETVGRDHPLEFWERPRDRRLP